MALIPLADYAPAGPAAASTVDAPSPDLAGWMREDPWATRWQDAQYDRTGPVSGAPMRTMPGSREFSPSEMDGIVRGWQENTRAASPASGVLASAGRTPTLRPLTEMATSSAPRLRPLGEVAAMPVNRTPTVAPQAPPAPTALGRAGSIASMLASLYGAGSGALGLPAMPSWAGPLLSIAGAGMGAPSVGQGAAQAGMAAFQQSPTLGAQIAGIPTAGAGAAPAVAGGVNPGAFSTGAGLAGLALGGAGMALNQPALTGFGSQLAMMAPIASWGPANAAATAALASQAAGGAAAGGAAAGGSAAGTAGAGAGAGAGSAGVGPLAFMFGPMMHGIGKEIARAFTDVPHDVREQIETQRALGKAETMLSEIATAATPEELWRALNRGVGTYGVPLDARYRTVNDLLADPANYHASIQAGVEPDFIAGTNAQLTEAVRQTVAMMNAARAGDPQAQAALAARTPQREGLLAKAISLMSGPTLRGSNSNNEGGGGAYQTGGGGAPEDVWGTLALSGGLRASPRNLSQSVGGYKAAAIAGLPVDLFQRYGFDDLSLGYDAATATERPAIDFGGDTFESRVRSWLKSTDDALQAPPSVIDEGGQMRSPTRRSFVPSPDYMNVGGGE